MNNQVLHDKYRNQLTNVHAMTVFTVSLIEIIGYGILILADVEFFSLKNHYLWYGVVFPIVINTLTHFIARKIVNNPAVTRDKKNTAIIIAALITSFVVAVIHKEYIVTSCAFIFPIILSAMFNSRKLLNTSFIASIFILLSVGLAFLLDKSITFHVSISLLVLFGFSFIAYLCGVLSINFSGQNYTTIESQAAQNDKLMQDILCDQMTELYNHHSFMNHLAEYVKVYNSNSHLCLAIIDIDNFKNVNDTYGHDCGDIVLTYLAKILKKYCANNITAYRYGGEEFAILFLENDINDAFDVLQNILNEFRNHKFNFSDHSITFSAGIAKYNENLNSTEFFERADKTLYKAKKEGKNRVLISK